MVVTDNYKQQPDNSMGSWVPKIVSLQDTSDMAAYGRLRGGGGGGRGRIIREGKVGEGEGLDVGVEVGRGGRGGRGGGGGNRNGNLKALKGLTVVPGGKSHRRGGIGTCRLQPGSTRACDPPAACCARCACWPSPPPPSSTGTGLE